MTFGAVGSKGFFQDLIRTAESGFSAVAWLFTRSERLLVGGQKEISIVSLPPRSARVVNIVRSAVAMRLRR
jgi:hypothetical protein